MAKTKVLITVKTYPTISTKYDELVCTAGFLEDGTWVRIYPVPYRKRAYAEQYKKYDWIELDLVKNKSDFRPESFRPLTLETAINVVGHLNTANNWEERKQLCLKKVYYNLSDLISEAKDKNICKSLAVFKPTEILDFFTEVVERDWSEKQKAALAQQNLFENKFEVV